MIRKLKQEESGIICVFKNPATMWSRDGGGWEKPEQSRESSNSPSEKPSCLILGIAAAMKISGNF